MFGLGKPRSKLGKYIDENGLDQGELAKVSKTNKETISRLCDGRHNASPNEKTITKVIGAIRKKGKDVRPEDFWDV